MGNIDFVAGNTHVTNRRDYGTVFQSMGNYQILHFSQYWPSGLQHMIRYGTEI